MAYQDYRQIMDDIDKNIESYYSKRFVTICFAFDQMAVSDAAEKAKTGKKKKKGVGMKEPASSQGTSSGAAASAAQMTVPTKPVMDHVVKAIQCRKEIMSSLKHVFPKDSF